MARPRFGTGARRSSDVSRLAEALSRPGIDPRKWIGRGTVCTVDGDGKKDVADAHAVHVSPRSVAVNVVLEPDDFEITATYSGIAGGRSCTIYAPIRPGDLVLLGLVDGDLSAVRVLAILNSQAHPMPLGDDGNLPIFRNDRLLVFAEDVPVDIRTRGGAQVLLEQNGEVTAKASKVTTDTDDTRLGARDAPEQLVLGTSYRGNEMPMLVALQAFVDAVAAAIAADAVIPPPLKAAVAAATSALNPLIGTMTSNDFLSRASRTK